MIITTGKKHLWWGDGQGSCFAVRRLDSDEVFSKAYVALIDGQFWIELLDKDGFRKDFLTIDFDENPAQLKKLGLLIDPNEFDVSHSGLTGGGFAETFWPWEWEERPGVRIDFGFKGRFFKIDKLTDEQMRPPLFYQRYKPEILTLINAKLIPWIGLFRDKDGLFYYSANPGLLFRTGNEKGYIKNVFLRLLKDADPFPELVRVAPATWKPTTEFLISQLNRISLKSPELENEMQVLITDSVRKSLKSLQYGWEKEDESGRIWTLYNICTDYNFFSPSNPYYGFLSREYPQIAPKIIKRFQQWQKNIMKKIHQEDVSNRAVVDETKEAKELAEKMVEEAIRDIGNPGSGHGQ